MENKEYEHCFDMAKLYCDLAVHCLIHNSKSYEKMNCMDYQFKCEYYNEKVRQNSCKKIFEKYIKK